MKIIPLLLLLVCTRAATAQPYELLGRFGASFIGAESIDFVKEDSFYFNGFYCTYGVTGKGVCEIKDGYLYLYFSREKAGLKPVQRPPEIIFTGGATTTVQVRVLNQASGAPVPYASVAIYHSRQGTTASDSGRAQLRIDPSTLPTMINCSSVGYQPVAIPIDSAGSYTITAYMQPGNNDDRILNNGEIWVYELGEITDTWFEARPAWGKGRFRIYRKREK